ncbi:Uncharacterised protein [Yersinia pekkanenii]|uniref:Uncharacterized protein n=1 Tax=Yersinia pekkanenii TaxID=1288385 RepID=A0A0T9P2D8_9GAMM|nr:Uncharacterised protein [Yersinia pekkanenii]CRY66824.1 Uncharacterised protein [Yersinia pekkanenii]
MNKNDHLTPTRVDLGLHVGKVAILRIVYFSSA